MIFIELLKVILLGIVEGITEWLPISSTGHMILVDEFIKLNVSEAFMEFFLVVIQLGAILAVVVLYWNKLWPFYIRKIPKKTQMALRKQPAVPRTVLTFVEKYCDKDKWILWFKILVACLPTIIIALPFNDIIEKKFYNYVVVAIMLIVSIITVTLAIQNIRNAEEKERAAVRAKNEQLRADLLRTISHDLRTPLTSISGNASNLISNYEKMDDPTRKQTFLDIYDDSMWLINLVENILSISRIEDGRMNLSISTELVSEVFEEALRHTNRHSGQHTITVQMDDDLLLAHMDAKLVVQVLINLVDNAIKYTPAGSHIVLSAAAQGESAVIRVSDDGPGIPDEAKEKVFEMFSTGEKRISDSRRSLGLGLALCRTIIAAHGGTITLSDNTPHGCIFTFTLPLGEVSLHE